MASQADYGSIVRRNGIFMFAAARINQNVAALCATQPVSVNTGHVPTNTLDTTVAYTPPNDQFNEDIIQINCRGVGTGGDGQVVARQ